MNCLLVVFSLAFVICSVFGGVEEEWSLYQKRFPRTSARTARAGGDPVRKEIFKKNYEAVQRHNEEAKKGLHSYTLAINGFSDWTEEEKRAILRKDNVPAPAIRSYVRPNKDGSSVISKYVVKPSAPLPDHFDWRDHGKVSPVKSQGGCSSCWAFGATAAIESMLMIKYNQSILLSEQHLMDCVGNEFGRPYTTCDYGGWPSWAYKYITDKGGYALADEYPYIEKTQECIKNSERFRYGDISGFLDITPGDEEEMKRVIAEVGPISVDIDASYMQGISGNEIVDVDNCGTERGNHIVTVVGYGTDNGKDYWLVKNSWGDWWADKGFGKIARGKNMCAIAMHANYPIRN